jgi:regulator of protease activity HflC (stomatin/prohibitin superfamily)
MKLLGRTEDKGALIKNPVHPGGRGFPLKGVLVFFLVAGLCYVSLDCLLRGEGFGAGGWRVPALLAALLLVLALYKFNEWERGIVLRLGRFHRVRGPGLAFLIPLLDRVVRRVDLRIRVTDFSAQETLTLDSVTVTVDAICFWLVWDPEKAVLEVEHYEEAVALSAKTALRNAVSSHDLSTVVNK